MKIKKLDMLGFKSFVDRTAIHFDHDVLGIVGPNGCGKSNIVDAIRWCMGEQSAKHLRGRNMEDVIFNGSETRSAHDMAEVTLTFENDRGDVPLEYRDYPEIAVTRRLYRNGDSEYLINKTQVRLRDVTDLFLGTGAGTKAYSIVEQGKVGLIVSAKAEDRRILIEEAAGITKFKSKKKQAEKKMELTQQNLLRVGDIVAEIERNLGSLKRQAAKAERYVAYRNELEDLQLHEASHKYLELHGWIQYVGCEVERLTRESDETRTALTAREAELEAVRLDAHAAEEALEVAQNAHFAAQNEVRAEEAEIARTKDKIESLKARELQATGELRELGENAERLVQERDGIRAQIGALESEESAASSEFSIEEERLAHLCKEHDAANASLGGLRKTMGEAQARVASAEAKLSGFERRQTETRARLERLTSERATLEASQVEQSNTARELSQAVEGLTHGKKTSSEAKEKFESELRSLRERIVHQEKALDEAKNAFRATKSRCCALLELQERLEGVGDGVKSLLTTKDPSLAGLVADRIEAPHELTQALAGLLGDRLQDVLVRDLDRGISLLEDLAAGKKGRATIRVAPTPGDLPAAPASTALSQLREDEGFVCALAENLQYASDDEALVRSLVGDAIVVKDAASARRLFAHAGDTPIVTVDGSVFHPDGHVSGGQGEELAAGMLESKREARELSEEVSCLEARVTERLSEHQESRRKLAELTSLLDQANKQAHADELALVRADKDLQRAQGQLETIHKRLERLAAEEVEVTSALSDADSERAEAERLLTEARTAIEDVAGKIQEAEQVALSWRAQVDEERHVVVEKKVKMASSREKLAAARGTLQRLSRSVDELTERQKRLDDELQTGANAIEEFGSALITHKAALDSALDRTNRVTEELASVRTTFEQFKSDLTTRETGLKELRTLANTQRDALTTQEMLLREKELAKEHILESVAEKFRGLHLPRIIGDYHLRTAPDDESRSRIAELVHLLERMGPVNLGAMREHEEAEKRFVFYSEQKADLERALADLERAISQMNRESRRLFQETFDAINEKFQEVFPKMFRGGRASLRLTNPDDMLETGIDVVAQPPGKKIASIELMSGGEKALTAVSLLFAIFQIKPSPFCILDEVDAPLDEANVARYNETVRSMTDRSQFILITHIKRTMQSVDVLYGVTMAEAGVSKLVSVKISESAATREREATAAVA